MDTDDDQALAELASGDVSPSSAMRAGRVLARSARAAGAGAVGSGRWLAGVLVDLAPRIPVRDQATLVEHHHGLTGRALAEELVKGAARASAGVGAASGALTGVEEMAPPAWLALPIELVVETVAVAAIEMKLIAELQEAFDQPVTGTAGERGMA